MTLNSKIDHSFLFRFLLWILKLLICWSKSCFFVCPQFLVQFWPLFLRAPLRDKERGQNWTRKRGKKKTTKNSFLGLITTGYFEKGTPGPAKKRSSVHHKVNWVAMAMQQWSESGLLTSIWELIYAIPKEK